MRALAFPRFPRGGGGKRPKGHACPTPPLALSASSALSSSLHVLDAWCSSQAAFYSEARDDHKALVTYTSPKHVVKPRGAPLGAVKIRQSKDEGTVVARPVDSDHIPTRVRELRERQRQRDKQQQAT